MIRTLKQRLIFFLLVPAASLLFLTGFFGFVYARKVMLNQWTEASIAKLRWAAHNIDMRLSEPIRWMEMFHETRGEHVLPGWILNQLEGLEGVTYVRLETRGRGPEGGMMPGMDSHMGHQRMMRFHHARIAEVTPPRYDTQVGHETVSLVSTLKDENEKAVGRLEVVMRFDHLMQDIIQIGWWQSDMACLVADSGMYITHTESMMRGRDRLGETNDPFELAILAAMKEKPFGTLRGPGHPPDKVAGFCRLERAPWTIILFASGKRVLGPIVRFRFYYALGGGLCIVLIILLIGSVAGKIVDSVREISRAAMSVAQGKYGDPLSPKSHDEIGQLTRSFNTMVQGLKERDFISNTFGRYVDQEIAKELMRRPEAARLGGEKREVAILFSDIRGFTPLSESLSPETTISVLNHYFSHMIEVIKKHQGIIVDFFGDGVLVFFDPLDGPIASTVHRAIRCAMEMQAEMETYRAETSEKSLPLLQMGVGLNAGQVVVGNIGSEARAKYGIVGSAVNLTQRIQEVANRGEVVISDSICHHAGRYLEIEKSFEVQWKGVHERMKLHVLKRFRDPAMD